MVKSNFEPFLKPKRNVFIVVDVSRGMGRDAVLEINDALCDVKTILGNTFKFNLIVCGSKTGDRTKLYEIEEELPELHYGGRNSVAEGLLLLDCCLKRRSRRGKMPDFGGELPLIVTIRHGGGADVKKAMKILSNNLWIDISPKYEIFVEKDLKNRIKTDEKFSGENCQSVICLDKENLKELIVNIISLGISKNPGERENLISDDIEENYELFVELDDMIMNTEIWK